MLLVVAFTLVVAGFLLPPRGYLLATAAVLVALGVATELVLRPIANHEAQTLLPLFVALVGVAGLVLGAFVRRLAAPRQACQASGGAAQQAD